MLELREHVYAWLLKKSRNSSKGCPEARTRAKGIMEDLRRDITSDIISLRRTFKTLRDEGKVAYSGDLNGEPLPQGYITVIRPQVEVSEVASLWYSVLEGFSLPEEDIETLKPIYSSLEGMSSEAMTHLVAGLVRLRNDQDSVAGQQVFSVSAKYLIGSSKTLMSLDKSSLKKFGIDLDRFAVRPSYVVIGGNVAAPQAVILVENPVAFETAVNSQAVERCVFICTFGYGLSAMSDDFGNQLAGIIETGESSAMPLYRNAPKELKGLHELLSHSELFFWGDLDIEGIKIYERLKKRLPHLRLSGLYIPMIEAITNPASRHEYVQLVSKPNQKYFVAQFEEGHALLNLCRTHGVDQELVPLDKIIKFAETEAKYPLLA
jgi:Wadjet anti plasmid transformation system JetA-like protein